MINHSCNFTVTVVLKVTINIALLTVAVIILSRDLWCLLQDEIISLRSHTHIYNYYNPHVNTFLKKNFNGKNLVNNEGHAIDTPVN